jgi:hypothetical protein
MPNKIIEFKVEGSGYFPLDMLRYDQAWPAHQDDIHALTSEARDVATLGKRQVLLHSCRTAPTTARWESFGWRVLKTLIWKRGKMVEADFKVIS